MKKYLVLIASLFITTSLFAQETEVITINQPIYQSAEMQAEKPKFGDLGKNAIGVAILGGGCGVYGLEYERFFGNAFGLAFIGSGYANEMYYESKKYQGGFSLSVMPELKLFHCEFAKGYDMTLFAWALAGINGNSSWDVHYVDGSYESRYFTWDGWVINAIAGVGFGFDFVFAKHISVPVQFGFIGQFPTTPIVSMCLGTGIRFVW